MPFEIKKTKNKEETTYKTIYIKQELAKEISRMAEENQTSFNNVVVSMIESCLAEADDAPPKEK